MKIIWNSNFESKLQKYIKKHPEIAELIKEKLKLFQIDPFDPGLRNHKLSGKLKDLKAIVIGYDCRIIYYLLETDKALLVNIGTHDEVY